MEILFRAVYLLIHHVMATKQEQIAINQLYASIALYRSRHLSIKA